MRTNQKILALALCALSLVGLPRASQAQLPNASASELALSGNNTATVRGFGAISVNPAGLAMPGSGFSLALVPIQGRAGLGPVKFSDLVDFEGVTVPTETKEAWLSAIEAAGGQSASVGANVSALALTIGDVGLQLSSVASANMTLPAGVAEALLFGNAGRDPGVAADLNLTGLGVDGFAASTAALSFAFGVGPAKVGLTGKYIVGHGLALANAESGTVSSNPIRVTLDAPVLGPCQDEALGLCTQDYNAGSGMGLDVGFMMDLSALTIGASMENVVNTFEWDITRLSYREGSVLFEKGTSESTFDETSFAAAPADLQARVADYVFKPTVRVGAAIDLPLSLTLSADIHRRLSDDGIALGPKSHVGVGAEFRALRILHLRAGAASITGGSQYSGGASLVLGPINFSAAAAVRDGDQIPETVFAQFTLSFGNR